MTDNPTTPPSTAERCDECDELIPQPDWLVCTACARLHPGTFRVCAQCGGALEPSDRHGRVMTDLANRHHADSCSLYDADKE